MKLLAVLRKCRLKSRNNTKLTMHELLFLWQKTKTPTKYLKDYIVQLEKLTKSEEHCQAWNQKRKSSSNEDTQSH